MGTPAPAVPARGFAPPPLRGEGGVQTSGPQDLPPATLAVPVQGAPERGGRRHVPPFAGEGTVHRRRRVGYRIRGRYLVSSPAPRGHSARPRPFRAVILPGGGCRAQAPGLMSPVSATAPRRPDFPTPGRAWHRGEGDTPGRLIHGRGLSQCTERGTIAGISSSAKMAHVFANRQSALKSENQSQQRHSRGFLC